MNIRLAITLLSLCLLTVGCDEKKAPADAAKPATAGAPAAPAARVDLSTPQAAALSFARALEAGDAASAKEACVGAEPALIDRLAPYYAASSTFYKTAAAKWPAPSTGNNPFAPAASLEQVDVTMNGDAAATVTPKNQAAPVPVKKVDGKWKVDAATADIVQDHKNRPLGSFTDAFTGATADIKADKYKSMDDITRTMESRVMGAMRQRKIAGQDR